MTMAGDYMLVAYRFERNFEYLISERIERWCIEALVQGEILHYADGLKTKKRTGEVGVSNRMDSALNFY